MVTFRGNDKLGLKVHSHTTYKYIKIFLTGLKQRLCNSRSSTIETLVIWSTKIVIIRAIEVTAPDVRPIKTRCSDGIVSDY